MARLTAGLLQASQRHEHLETQGKTPYVARVLGHGRASVAALNACPCGVFVDGLASAGRFGVGAVARLGTLR